MFYLKNNNKKDRQFFPVFIFSFSLVLLSQSEANPRLLPSPAKFPYSKQNPNSNPTHSRWKETDAAGEELLMEIVESDEGLTEI